MTIQASCPKCGKDHELKDDLQGKPIRCNGCEETFVAEALVEVEVPDKASAPAADAEEDDVDDFDSPRKRRRKKVLGMPLWVRLPLLIVVAVGVTLGVLWYQGWFGSFRVTKENFARLQQGMSEDEVKSILGRHTHEDDSAWELEEKFARDHGKPIPDRNKVPRRLIWEKGENKITVEFVEGKARGLYKKFKD